MAAKSDALPLSVLAIPYDENCATLLAPNSKTRVQVVPDDFIFVEPLGYFIRNVGLHVFHMAQIEPDVETKSLNVLSLASIGLFFTGLKCRGRKSGNAAAHRGSLKVCVCRPVRGLRA